MKKYIVSIVLTKREYKKGIINGSKGGNDPSDYELSVQNLVSVLSATSPDEAYGRVATQGRLQYPGYNITCKVVVETNAADLGIEEE